MPSIIESGVDELGEWQIQAVWMNDKPGDRVVSCQGYLSPEARRDLVLHDIELPRSPGRWWFPEYE